MLDAKILKNLYYDYFKIGVACEKINDRFKNHEIGNPDKEALMKRHFNSMTCANELKPAYNMGCKSPDATEEYVPFKINPAGHAMLDWARDNGLKVRGHVMVWHSQCPNEVFAKGYEPVTIPTDPELLKERPFLKYMEKLDPVCFVDRDTLIKRMQSYIRSLLEYMYENGYADVIYAWDVVNEAIEPAYKQETGLRNSYWYRIIGDDFMYFAFKAAHDAVTELSVKYAGRYGIDPFDDKALNAIRPLLFYNDYNEWQKEKKSYIIAALNREGHGHGSIIGEGLIDGIGMQGHLSDNNDVGEYLEALYEYSKLVKHVHITELDVKCTCTNVNAFYYQAVFYKELFDGLVKAVRDGVNLSSVTFWGLTDDNSWIRGANPLLFNGDLTPKASFKAVCSAITHESIGEPEEIKLDFSDRTFVFTGTSDAPFDLAKNGFMFKGFGNMEVKENAGISGKPALYAERFSDWGGLCFDVSDFMGQTVTVRGAVKSPSKALKIHAAVDEPGKDLAVIDMNGDTWVEFSCKVRIPSGYHSLSLCMAPTDHTDGRPDKIFVNKLSLSLVGIKEEFEDDYNIASVRGMGHLPMLSTVGHDHHCRDHALLVSRQEKDATVKFDITPYIGYKVEFTAFVKTDDAKIFAGLDLKDPLRLADVDSVGGEWNKITFETTVPDDLKSAEVYIETDGNADMLIDDILVRPI